MESLQGAIQKGSLNPGSDGATLYAFLQEEVLPFVNSHQIAMRVMGDHWKTATDEQKERFQKAFVPSLFKVYGLALRMVELVPLQHMRETFEEQKNGVCVAKVSALLRESTGEETNMVFSLNESGPNSWQIYNIEFDSFNFTYIFRQTFSADAERYGLEELIRKWEQKSAWINAKL